MTPEQKSHLEAISKYATPKGIEVIQAVIEKGSVAAGARHLGVSRATARTHINRAEQKAKLNLYDPTNGLDTNYPTEILHEKATVHRKDGKVVQTWERVKPNQEMVAAAWETWLGQLAKELPALPPVPAPHQALDQLLCQYTITDYHLGMLASAREASTDWNLDKAKTHLINWFRIAVNEAPAAHTAVFAQLGDFLHADSIKAVTPRSGHLLDAVRFTDVIDAAEEIVKVIVNLLLQKHQHVHIVWCTGNHDETSSMWMRRLVAALYRDEPRVSVETSDKAYYQFVWGKQWLGFHHGHGKRPATKDLVATMVNLFRSDWGSCEFAEVHSGHFHNDVEQDFDLAKACMHRTIAPNDHYSASGGYPDVRDAKVITYHKERGRVGVNIISSATVDNLEVSCT